MSSVALSDRHAVDAGDLRRKQVLSPEGVPLVFTVALAGERLAAFLLDCAWMLLPLIGLALLAITGLGGWPTALALLGFFLVRNGWFMAFELRSQGRTPGKRRMGLRVIDAAGGVLSAEQVIVRNLTREAETFVPLIALAQPEFLASSGPGLVRLLAVLWIALFLLLPLLGRDRRRVGDFLAGTIVVREPRMPLLRDLLEREPRVEETELHFSPEELELYGVYELQVLEELLRNEPSSSDAFEVVAERIREKLGRTAEHGLPARRFIEAFYRAQRARLEQDLLLGRARERKRRGRLRRQS